MRLGQLCMAAAVLVGLAAGPAGLMASEKPPTVAVELLAEQTAWVPGETVNLAIRFKVEDGWHIYWRNPGEGGLEPSFKWEVPAGWRVGDLAYPFPRRYIDAGGEHTFILDGEPTILAPVEVPKEVASGSQVTVGVDVTWMACRKACFLGGKKLTVTLPIAGGQVKAEPANEDAFQLARGYLPQSAEKAKYLKRLEAVADIDKAKPGARFEVAIVFDVAEGHHINSHRPLREFLVPTDVFHQKTEGLYIGRARFPAGKVEPSGLPGEQLSVYRGRAVVLLPVEAEPGLTGSEVRIRGVATYQACSDQTKVCFPPMAVEWELVLPVAKAHETPQPAHAELFETARREVQMEEQRLEGLPGRDIGQGKPADGGSGPTSDAGPTTSVPAPSLLTSDSWLGQAQAFLARLGLAGYLIMSLVGGLILNLMPCVLPVISIKVLSFVQQAKESRRRVLTLGLAFAAGIELSFIMLGVLVVGLGRTWGGFFQYPQVIIGLASVVTAFSLSLFGVFSLFPPRIVGDLAVRVEGEGHLSAFAMGLLATVLGTACTAPFLAGAVAIAAQQPAVVGMLIFVTAGLGMSLPYVILAAKPMWVRFVPKAGPWMRTFEHLMGFCLLATVVWLLNPLAAQIGGYGLLLSVLFLLLVSLAAWLYGKVEYRAAPRRKITYYGLAVVVVVGGWWLCFQRWSSIPGLIERQRKLALAKWQPTTLASRTADEFADVVWKNNDIPWIPYTRERARRAVESGYTVFIDYTAEWCVNCKANEKAVINTRAVREAMQRLGVLPFKADYTLPSREIAEDLKTYGSGGVPLYLIIPAGMPDSVIRLDEVLTASSLIGGLERAGPSKPSLQVGGS
ncbi:MAG: protein-disulfide reductase DsbD family protein [Phycisphaerae bacterium]